MINTSRLYDKNQTGQAMRKMVNNFSGDLENFKIGNNTLSQIPLENFYDIVKSLPYKKDTAGVEIITRPIHLLTSPFKGYDCKKKAVLIAAWLKQNDIPFEFIAVSNQDNKQVHHVIINALINGEWKEIDPTYTKNELFKRQKWTKAETLSGLKSGEAPVLVELYGTGNNINSLAAEFLNYRNINNIENPEYLGAAISAAGVVAIITGAIAAAATITVSIVNAVQSRKTDERAAAAETQKQQFQLKVIEQQQTEKQTEHENQAENLKKYGLIGGGILAAVLLFR